MKNESFVIQPLTMIHDGNYVRTRTFLTVKKELGYFAAIVLSHYYRPQRSCGKVIFSQASVILFTGGGVLSQHALQVVSQHALQQVSGGGVSKHALQVSRPTPKGEV